VHNFIYVDAQKSKSNDIDLFGVLTLTSSLISVLVVY